MTQSSTSKGHDIVWSDSRGWLYQDTGEEVGVSSSMDRPCKHCGKAGKDGLDACLREMLPGVASACCGHGDRAKSFVRFENGTHLSGFTVSHPEQSDELNLTSNPTVQAR